MAAFRVSGRNGALRQDGVARGVAPARTGVASGVDGPWPPSIRRCAPPGRRFLEALFDELSVPGAKAVEHEREIGGRSSRVPMESASMKDAELEIRDLPRIECIPDCSRTSTAKNGASEAVIGLVPSPAASDPPPRRASRGQVGQARVAGLETCRAPSSTRSSLRSFFAHVRETAAPNRCSTRHSLRHAHRQLVERVGRMGDADAVHVEEDDRREQSGALVPVDERMVRTMWNRYAAAISNKPSCANAPPNEACGCATADSRSPRSRRPAEPPYTSSCVAWISTTSSASRNSGSSELTSPASRASRRGRPSCASSPRGRAPSSRASPAG